MLYSQLVPMLLSHYAIEYESDETGAAFLCPFHEEGTPSCHMKTDNGRWGCFGCSEHGDFFGFILRMEDDNSESALRLHTRLTRGEDVEAVSRGPVEEGQGEREEPFDYVAAFTRLPRIDWAMLSKKHDAYRYFVRRRGISPYTLSAFDARLTDSEDYPVVIPVMRAGEMMGYVKRYVGRDPKARRYLYNKGFRAKEAMAYHRLGEDGPCLVVEGIMDYLKAAQFGARHVAAILSWQIKQPQVDFLEAQGVDEVVCALDDDPVGRSGCELLGQYFGVKRFRYPGPPVKDVGDLNQNEFWYGYENAGVPDAIAHGA